PIIDLRPHPRSHSFPTRRSSDLWSASRWLTSVCSRFRATFFDELRYASRRERRTLGSIDLGRWPSTLRLLCSWQRCTTPRSPKLDRKSTRLNSSHVKRSYAVFCL